MSTFRKCILTMFLFAVSILTLFASNQTFGLQDSDVTSVKTMSMRSDESNYYYYYYYYYQSLNDMAKKFYTAIDEMYQSGDLMKGNIQYDLVEQGTVTEEQVKDYVSRGISKIPVAFGSARDAYYMDHPDLFYIDIYKLSLSAGTQGTKYVGFIDSGREKNYYLSDSEFNSEASIKKSIGEYEKKLGTIVAQAKKINDVVEKIKYVNKAICDTVTYDFCVDVIQLTGETIYLDGYAYVQTAYGALVKGKAVCGGYSMAFKAVMDRLNIPCVVIQGSARPVGSEGYEAHMWNAVQLDNMWYAVDTTWNDTVNNQERYLLIGDEILSKTHLPDSVISTSGYELKYPALKPYNYGVDEDTNGMRITGEYTKIDGDESVSLLLSCGYDGKGALKLAEEGKYLAYRSGVRNGNEIEWSISWVGLASYYEFMMENNGDGGGWEITDATSTGYFNNSTYCIQFVLLDYKPDSENKFIPYLYKDELDPDHMLTDYSVPYINEEYLNFVPTPYPTKITPDGIVNIDNTNYIDVTIQYSEKLIFVEEDTTGKPQFKVTSKYSDIEKYIKIENARFHEDTNSVTFRFYPSKAYTHDWLSYRIRPTNLISAKTKLVPDDATIIAKRDFVICNKILPGGRLYVKAYGEPQMVSNEDMSMQGFKDKNGNYLSENQRSQLMLVVNKTTSEKDKELKDYITDAKVLGGATYEIDLHVCGILQKVPQGSFMQVGFGFPEGYGPDDAGTTFKVYHYKRDEYDNIIGVEEIPCVITEYGIIATVDSFSPFAIVAVEKDSIKNEKKSIYAHSMSNGGKIKLVDGKKGITSVEKGQSVNYKITPDRGYKIDRVFLNGKDVTSKMRNGELAFTYDELDSSSELVVVFISEVVATKLEEKGISLIQPMIVVKNTDVSATTPSEETHKSNNVGMIIGIIVGVMAAGLAVGAGVYFCLKKNKSKQESNSTPTSKTKGKN